MNASSPLVIYTHGGGRLGNQVLRFVHWIAWARAQSKQIEVLNLAFWPYADCFSLWRDHPGCVFPARFGWADLLARLRMALPGRLRQWSETKTRLPRAVQSVGGWWPSWQSVTLDIVREESLDLADRAFYARVTRRRITTCCGWRIACWDLVATQQEELRSFFRPAPEFERRAADFVGELRANHDVIVGLFIRQSDYREWNDGRFYFSTESYVVWLRQLLDLYQGKRVAFVIASEERQAEALFAGLPVYFATGTPNAGGHWFESWVELSCCDVIVSPPSTFSATAAFLGDLPIWPLVAGDQALAFDQLIPDGMIGASRHPVFGLAVK